MRPVLLAIVLLLVITTAVWWVMSAPPAGLVIAPPYAMGDTPQAILAVQDRSDPIASSLETIALEIPGHDEVILQEHRNRAFISATDGRIWKVDLESGEAEPIADPPLMPAGMRVLPTDEDTLCFCGMRMFGETYPANERIGLYELDTRTGKVRLLLDRVPLPPPISTPRSGNEGTVFAGDNLHLLKRADMTGDNSRLIAFCNDLDISADGKRIYFSEPFSREDASMGGGAFREAIALGNNGRLWLYDREQNAAGLVAQDYAFVDGVLIEDSPGREESILINEATKFRMLRVFVGGERAGQDEVVWADLPGVPDGLDRDADGRIWVGLLKERSGLLTWLHRNPWVKPFFLRLPLDLLPVPKATGILALSPDASEALYYAAHDGSRISDIAVVVPGAKHLYLATMTRESPGIHRIPHPLLDAPTKTPPAPEHDR